MDNKEKRRCNRCKVLLTLDCFNIKRSGEYMKNCIRCNMKMAEYRQANKCKHGKRKSQCKECGGSEICEHNRIKSQCKECGGSHICEHNRMKSQCKECGGSQICEHEKIRSRCKDCCGGSICEHDRLKSTCRDCCGGSICEHGKRKARCIDCDGSEICDHNRLRAQCKDCGGSSICEHNKRRTLCKDCGGGALCEHNKERRICKICDPCGHLAMIVKNHVNKALKSDKSKHSIEYLDCTIEEFKQHIEDRFAPDMTWENYGEEWHIDHIVPIKYKENGKIPTIEDVIKRLHYTNTKPMWTEENLSKGNRYVDI